MAIFTKKNTTEVALMSASEWSCTGHGVSLDEASDRRRAGRGREEGMRSAGLAIVAVSAAALLCAAAMVVEPPSPSVLSFSFFSSSASAPSASSSFFSSSSTFMLPASAAVNGYTKDLENMQQTLQADSLKPAGVVGDAPNLLAELGDG